MIPNSMLLSWSIFLFSRNSLYEGIQHVSGFYSILTGRKKFTITSPTFTNYQLDIAIIRIVISARFMSIKVKDSSRETLFNKRISTFTQQNFDKLRDQGYNHSKKGLLCVLLFQLVVLKSQYLVRLSLMLQNCSDSFLIALQQSGCVRIYPHGIENPYLNNLTEPKLVFQETFKSQSLQPIAKDDDDSFMKAINEVDIDTFLNIGTKKNFAETGRQIAQKKAMTPKMLEVNSFLPNNQTTSEQQPDQTLVNSVQKQLVYENVLPVQLNQQTSSKAKGAEQKKEDRKNIPGNTLKFALKAYSNPNFLKVIRQIHFKCGISNTSQAIQCLSSKMNWTFGLNDVREELCEVGDENERAYRRAFLIFYRWVMRKVYPIHVIKESKIGIKQEYLRQKNILVYLPDAQKKTPQRKSRNAKKNEETPVNSIQDSNEHFIHDFSMLRLYSTSNTSQQPLFRLE